MEMLKQRIREEGQVLPGDIIKVDGFLNHQIDVELMDAIGGEFARLFGDSGATRVLTVEASGIAIGLATARALGLPLLFAKKGMAKNIGQNIYSADVYSYTRGATYGVYVSQKYLHAEDRVLIVDDFLANGQACMGLVQLCRNAGAEVAGIGIAIEKKWQRGSELLRREGLPVHSLAVIERFENGEAIFA